MYLHFNRWYWTWTAFVLNAAYSQVPPDPVLLPTIRAPPTHFRDRRTGTGSDQACKSALLDFYRSNIHYCQRSNPLNDPAPEHGAYLNEAIKSWGARLCSDPELWPEYSDCQVAFFCRVVAPVGVCMQEFLQAHLNHDRFKMDCSSQRPYLIGDQPDTIAGCLPASTRIVDTPPPQVAVDNRPYFVVTVADGSLQIAIQAERSA